MLESHFRMLARYNAWANETLYGVVARLSDAEYRKTRAAAFFGSIHGTLNHLLVVDKRWFGRIFGDLDPTITRLDQILHESFADLRQARVAEDKWIVEQVDALAPEDLERSFDYRDSRGQPWTMRTDHGLATVFNHQTHHRGQVHALLKETDVAPPPLDIPVYLRETG